MRYHGSFFVPSCTFFWGLGYRPRLWDIALSGRCVLVSAFVGRSFRMIAAGQLRSALHRIFDKTRRADIATGPSE